MRILLTNDDGMGAPGLTALMGALSADHEVYVIAPDRERSAVSHKITLRTPLLVRQAEPEEAVARAFTVSGSPADCVRVGVIPSLIPRPALVISGINRGTNVGIDVLYSGTVAGAREGLIRGIPSLAVSTQGPDHSYALAVEVVLRLLPLLEKQPLPGGQMLNINVPRSPAGSSPELRLTRQEGNLFQEDCRLEEGERPGDRIATFFGHPRECEFPGGTDCHALRSGFISVTPLGTDLNSTGRKGVEEILSRHPFWGGAERI